MTPQEMQEKRLGIIAQQTALNDKVIAEGRDFNGEEQTQYTRMDNEQKEIKAKIDRALSLAALTAEIEQPIRAGVRPAIEGTVVEPAQKRASADYKKNFVAWAGQGVRAPHTVTAVLEKAVGTQGGYLTPMEYDTNLVKLLTNANIIRKLATVRKTTMDSNITLEASLPTFAWIDETGEYALTDQSYARSVFGAYKLGGIVKVSEELFQDAFLDLGELISEEGARGAGLAEEAAFIGGDGNKKPTGILTTPGTNSVVSAAKSAVTFDDVLAMVYATPRPYRDAASFIFADTAIMSLRKLKSSTGEYIWQPSQSAGAPDLLYGKPLYTSDFLAALAANSQSGLFGDISQYYVLDRAGWVMQRLNELYAETGMIGFKLFERVDGHLLRPNAITILTQAAA